MWRDRTIKPTVLFQTCRPGAWEPETPEEEMARIPLQGNLCESFLLPSSSLSSGLGGSKIRNHKQDRKQITPPASHPGEHSVESPWPCLIQIHISNLHCQFTSVLSILAAVLAQHQLCSGDSTRCTEARTVTGIELRLTH